MARRRANENVENDEELGLQLTPMIDVIFQLLIFFMVNIKFRTLEGLLKAFLPKTDPSVVKEEDPDQVVITITDAGGTLIVAVNGRAVGGLGEKEQYEALETRLDAIKNSAAYADEMPPVIIDAAPRLRYKYVIYALNVCGKLDLKNVMFMTPHD